MKTEFATEAIKGTPAVAGAVAAAFTLNQAIAVATAVYIVVQCAYLIRKWWREEKDYARKLREDANGL